MIKAESSQVQQTVQKYPRLARVLMAIAEEVDPVWAASIILSAQQNRVGMAHALVREAWLKRNQYKGTSVPLRGYGLVVGPGESVHANSTLPC